MRSAFFLILFFFFITFGHCLELHLDAEHWSQAKGNHFIVFYESPSQLAPAQDILRHAEEDYSAILDRIGSNKVDNFWTWDDRVKIVYFDDQSSFLKATGQPAWAKGVSIAHMSNFKMRLIISFRGQEDFIDNVLPHEISHLILHDFMKGRMIPRWFDEGIAQLDEANNTDEHRLIVARLVEANQGIGLSMLDAFPSMINEDPAKAAIFYAESLYIVDFLIKNYGKDSFGKLCRLMRDGSSFEEALARAYYPTINSWQSLNEKWNQYMVSLAHRSRGIYETR